MPPRPIAGGPKSGVVVRAPRPRLAATRMPGWGWLEWVVVAQTALPAMLFVPGMAPIRTLTRVAAFGISLTALAAVGLSGRRAHGRRFPAIPWLAAAAVWLCMSILHPGLNSPISGIAQVTLNLAIMAPAFWGGAAMSDPRQLTRLMLLLLVCNGASALMGIGQFYRPSIFDPPVMNIVGPEGTKGMLSIETADGRKVVRPCGLTDAPGGAAAGGAMAALVGLSWALRSVPRWQRLGSLGLALVGVAVIYLSQVRSVLIMLVVSLVFMFALLLLRGDVRKAILLGGGTLLTLVLGMLWTLRVGSAAVAARFLDLLSSPASKTYHDNRGRFLAETFERFIWDMPLGAGLGRWGMMYANFGDHAPSLDRGMLWAELQWTAWLYDGGLPLMVLYVGALTVAIANTMSIARTCQDKEISFWAVPIFGLGLSAVAMCFNAIPFIGPGGVQFWALFAALHAAAERTRIRAKRERRLPA
ncbi:MAG: hypothetical protein ABI353_09035 [Isosphaeraceae bacterium]